MAPWVAGLQQAIDASERFRDMNLEALASIEMLEAGMAGETAAAAANAGATGKAANAAMFLGTVNVEASENVEKLASRLNDQMDAADKAAVADEALSSRLNDMKDAALEAQAAMDRLEYDISSTAAASVTASALAGPAMDHWKDSIAEAAAAAEMAEIRIDALDRALADSGEDAAAAAAGLKAYAAAENDAAGAAARWELTQAAAIGMADTLAAIERGGVVPAMEQTADATGRSSIAIGRWGLTLNAVHWIISGAAEILAVTLPAAIAASAGAFVLYQGAIEEVGFRLTAMYGATEATAAMLSKTTGDVLGLGHAFQTAQNEANPIAYELLGAYLNAARSHMVDLAQAGLQVDRALAELGARIDVDFRAQGASLNSLLANMTSDLIEIGQVFGNFGHAILNLAADMPGLAEALLAIVDGLSKAVEWLTNPAWYNFGGHLFTIVMGIEEFMRWGGLLVNILGRLGFTVEELGPKFLSMERFTGVFMSLFNVLPNTIAAVSQAVADLIGRMTFLGTAGEDASDALSAFSTKVDSTLGSLSLMDAMLVTGVIAGLAYLTYKILTTKTATQEWTASLQKAVEAASNVNAFAVIATNMVKISAATEQANAQMAHASVVTKGFNDVLGAAQSATLLPFKGAMDDLAYRTAGYSAEVDQATTSNKGFDATVGLTTGGLGFLALAANHVWDSFAGGVSKTATLSKAMQQQQTDMRNLVSGGQAVSKAFGGNLADGWALASQAGVNLATTEVRLGKNANIAGQEIENLVAGYKAMDQVGGTLNNDMNALAAQAGLADTKVSGLNQAWDQFLSNATGLTSSFAGLKTDIGEINNAITTSGKKFDVFGGAAVSSTQEAAYALTSFSGVGAQVWQNYDAALQQAQQYTDSLRIAATTGVVGQREFTQQIAYTAQQLLPYARYSKAAASQLGVLVQEAGGPAITSYKQLKDWIDKNTESSKQFMKQTVAETGAMSDATSVAEDYASTLDSQVAAALQSASLSSANLTGAATQLDSAWTKAGGHLSGPVESAFAGLITSLFKVYGNTKTAEGIANGYARQMGLTSGQVKTLDKDIQGLIHQLNSIPKNIPVNINIATNVSGATAPAGVGLGHLGTGASHQGGTWAAAAGLALVGESGPELVRFGGGESVLPSWQTAGITHGGGGGGEGPIGLAIHSPVYVGGTKIQSTLRTQTLTYNRRNTGNNWNLRNR